MHLLRTWPQWAGLRLLGILIVALLLNRFLKAFTARLVKLASSETRVAKMREQHTRTLAGILYSAGTGAIVLISFLTALPELGVSLTPVAALAGLASVALGFGAQNLVRDIISGFLIVFEDQYVVGDIIRLADTVGRVEHVTLRRTLLRDDKGSLVTIANGEIRQVANLSRDWSQMFVDISVAAEERLEAALQALEKVCADVRADGSWSAALVDGPRVLGLEALSAAGATLRIQVRTAPTRQYDVARELRRRIKGRFEQEEIRLISVQRIELVGQEELAAPPVKSS